MVRRLLDSMAERGDRLALASGNDTWTYRDLLDRLAVWDGRLAEQAAGPGTIVSIEGDYGLDSVAAFLSAAARDCILVPLSSDSRVHHEKFCQIAGVQVRVDATGGVARRVREDRLEHPFYAHLTGLQHPGLVLFSSGSTGEPKAAVHDLNLLLKKFQEPRHCYRTLVFLQLDHIGGVNTLFYTLSNGGAVVACAERSPAAVCAAIAQHGVELLPTSPTFLNLLLLSEVHRQYDLSSLRLITYGTEAMPDSTLVRLRDAFPDVRLLQTYGLTEVGILRSQSRDSGSLWMRVGGSGYETKIVDGRLFIRAESAMLGYLNAPSPFDAEGFLDTGDMVETDGEWLRVLGRASDIINVGGQKVFPAEVETVLLSLDNVEDAVVYGEPHPLTGRIVVARVRLREPESLESFKTRMRAFCRTKLPSYKVPARVVIGDSALHSARFKRQRPAKAALEGAGA